MEEATLSQRGHKVINQCYAFMVPKSPPTCKDVSACPPASHVSLFHNVNMALPVPLPHPTLPTYLLAHNNLCMRDCPRRRSEQEREREREEPFLSSPRSTFPSKCCSPPTGHRSWTSERAGDLRLSLSLSLSLVSRQHPSNHEPTNQATRLQQLIQIRHHAPSHDHRGRGKTGCHRHPTCRADEMC